METLFRYVRAVRLQQQTRLLAHAWVSSLAMIVVCLTICSHKLKESNGTYHEALPHSPSDSQKSYWALVLCVIIRFSSTPVVFVVLVSFLYSCAARNVKPCFVRWWFKIGTTALFSQATLYLDKSHTQWHLVDVSTSEKNYSMPCKTVWNELYKLTFAFLTHS